MCAWRKVRLQARACSHPSEFPTTMWLITTNIHLKMVLQSVSKQANKNLKKIVYISPCSYKGSCVLWGFVFNKLWAELHWSCLCFELQNCLIWCMLFFMFGPLWHFLFVTVVGCHCHPRFFSFCASPNWQWVTMEGAKGDEQCRFSSTLESINNRYNRLIAVTKQTIQQSSSVTPWRINGSCFMSITQINNETNVTVTYMAQWE